MCQIQKELYQMLQYKIHILLVNSVALGLFGLSCCSIENSSGWRREKQRSRISLWSSVPKPSWWWARSKTNRHINDARQSFILKCPQFQPTNICHMDFPKIIIKYPPSYGRLNGNNMTNQWMECISYVHTGPNIWNYSCIFHSPVRSVTQLTPKPRKYI